ncbi:hypothetical protein ACLMJK_004844 [Lecanora helva]
MDAASRALILFGFGVPARYVSPYPPLGPPLGPPVPNPMRISYITNPPILPRPRTSGPMGIPNTLNSLGGASSGPPTSIFQIPRYYPVAARKRILQSSGTVNSAAPSQGAHIDKPGSHDRASKHTTLAPGTIPPPLPPSVEEAYRKKCIQLKRRLNEVEEANDASRVRIVRLNRGIRKMRLERAYLLEGLAKRMKKNGGSVDGFQGLFDEESEGSSEAPPTPNEKPLRSKRSHRRPASSPPPMPQQQQRPLAPSQTHPGPSYEAPGDRFRELQYQQAPTTNGPLSMQYQQHPSTIGPNPINPITGQVSRGPQPPPTAFQEFLVKHVLPNRDRFPYRSEEEGIAMGRDAWEDRAFGQVRVMCEENYERNLHKYNEELEEVNRGMDREREVFEQQRAREMEAYEQHRVRDTEAQQGELPPPPPSRDGGAGGGGFTSING